ncbi:MAG: P-II family nitrogen regulator [Nitrospirota bacterium]
MKSWWFYIPEEKELPYKRIEAIIRPEKVSAVCEALDNAGHSGATFSLVERHEERSGWVNHIRSMSYTVTMLSKTRVEVVVNDEDADRIIKAIGGAALTGEPGDGEIFVHTMADAIRIRTRESGMAAV